MMVTFYSRLYDLWFIGLMISAELQDKTRKRLTIMAYVTSVYFMPVWHTTQMHLPWLMMQCLISCVIIIYGIILTMHYTCNKHVINNVFVSLFVCLYLSRLSSSISLSVSLLCLSLPLFLPSPFFLFFHFSVFISTSLSLSFRCSMRIRRVDGSWWQWTWTSLMAVLPLAFRYQTSIWANGTNTSPLSHLLPNNNSQSRPSRPSAFSRQCCRRLPMRTQITGHSSDILNSCLWTWRFQSIRTWHCLHYISVEAAVKKKKNTANPSLKC